MKDKIQQIIQNAKKELNEVNLSSALNELRIKYLSKKSEFISLFALMKDLSPEEKAAFGKVINESREEILNLFAEKEIKIKQEELANKLQAETIDISLPGRNEDYGSKNPLLIIKDEVISFFINQGYTVAEGPEIEEDYYNFELLNIPKNHPARDMQDTFYIDEKKLLRTHTSPVQARTMLLAKGQPLKIISPGKVYRRDNDDLTHSHQFMQVEGLVINKGIHFGHLTATLDSFAKNMFGEKRQIRLRPSYFPFTEPSVEVDVSCFDCGGKGCRTCKNTGWIEILGAGMVHPNVLRMSGYDSDVYSGFAFGVGLERVALLRYAIDDIRRIYQNDLRFLNQFRKGK